MTTAEREARKAVAEAMLVTVARLQSEEPLAEMALEIDLMHGALMHLVEAAEAQAAEQREREPESGVRAPW